MVKIEYDEKKHCGRLDMTLTKMASMTGQDVGREFIFDIIKEYIHKFYDTTPTQELYEIDGLYVSEYIHKEYDTKTGIVTIWQNKVKGY